MCLFVTLLFLGPRFALIVYWAAWPARWNAAFDTAIFPILGIVFVPWTTLMYVLVAPGGVESWDYLWILLGIVVDLASLAGSGGYGRSRYGDSMGTTRIA
jgi:hypothetical protein